MGRWEGGSRGEVMCIHMADSPAFVQQTLTQPCKAIILKKHSQSALSQ